MSKKHRYDGVVYTEQRVTQCKTGRAHTLLDWRDRWSQDQGDGSYLAMCECRWCGMRRLDRVSYVAAADPHRATGDGRDWSAFAPPPQEPEPTPEPQEPAGLRRVDDPTPIRPLVI